MASHRPLVAIFSLALVLRLAMVVALVLGWGADGFLIDDSASYLWRAAEERWQADMMPLYVLYLSAFRALLGPDPLWPVLGQALIDSLTCVVIAAAAGVLDHRLRLVAGVFAALNPTQIVMATLVLTDTLFLFFYALALWAALAWLERPSWRTAAGCGLALGLGVLTRAMLLPWVLALPVVLLAGGAVMRHRLAPASAQLALALALALALQAPVLARNHAETGGYGLTSQGGVHALYWIVPLVMEARDGTPHGEGARLMAERFAEVVDAANHPDPFSHSRAMSRAAVGVLGELGPGPIAKAWAFGAAINLFSPAVILSTPVRTLPRMGFYATPGESKLDKIVTFLFRNDNSAYTLILLAAATGTVLLRAVQLFGLWRAVRAGLAGKRTVLAATLVLAAWIGFVLVINGPIASAKYRSPAEPAFAVLFALALARRETLAGPFTAARAGV